MYGGGLTVLNQAQIDDFLDGIQLGATTAFSVGSKRRKAISKFAHFYFGHEQPELSPSQVELVLLGDFGASGNFGVGSSSRGKGGKRTGLIQLCGLVRRKKGSSMPQLNQSASAGIDFLDKVVNVEMEHPSNALFRETFVKLSLEMLSKMCLDLHVMQRSRKAAFRLVLAVLKYHRINQRELEKMENYEPILLGQLLQNDDAHDLYVEWEAEDEMAISTDNESQPPEEWDHVMMEGNSDDDDDAENTTKNLLAAVMEESIKENSGANASNDIVTDGTFKSDGKISDPLGLRSEDIRTLDQSISASMRRKKQSFSPNAAFGMPPLSAPSAAPEKPKLLLRQTSSKRLFKSFLRKTKSGTGKDETGSVDSGGSGAGTKAALSPPVSPTAQRKLAKTESRVLEEIYLASKAGKQSQEAQDTPKVFSTQTQSKFVKKNISILPVSEKFDPALFLYTVHRDASLRELIRGLRHLEKESEDHKGRMKSLVLENFNEFVHCRHTIDHIQELMQKEAPVTPQVQKQKSAQPYRKGRRGRPVTPPSQQDLSRTAKVEVTLEDAIGTVGSHFTPLLEKRKRIRKLRRAAEMLSRLEYLWKLPHQLRDLMSANRYIEAVIEFSNVGHHLGLLGEDQAAEKLSSKTRDSTFFKDTVQDLEACGLQMCETLTKILTQPIEFDESSSIRIKTNLALEQEGHLLSTDALSLLLELRDHVPKTSKIYAKLSDDKDPFLMLQTSQQKHSQEVLEKITESTSSNLAELLKRGGFVALEYLVIWEQARNSIDPSSASSGKEHIFDVLSRVNENGGDETVHQISERNIGVETLLDNDDEDDDMLNEQQNFAQDKRRSGSTDLLFDIRKRFAANCTLADLAERLKSSDSMAMEILGSFIKLVASLIKRSLNLAHISTEENHSHNTPLALVKRAMKVIFKMQRMGALTAAGYAYKRKLRKLQEMENTEETEKCIKDLEGKQVYPVIEKIVSDLTRRSLDALVKLVEERRKKQDEDAEQWEMYEAIHNQHGDVDMPQMPFVLFMVTNIFSTMDEIKEYVRQTKTVSFWSKSFLERQVKTCSTTLIRCLSLICEWIELKSEGAGSEMIPLLFSDCRYSRVQYMEHVQRLLKSSIDPSMDPHPQESVKGIFEKFIELETALMARYVQLKGKGLKAIIDEALEFENNINDWPNPPTMVRHYTLDLLMHFVNVVAECSHRVGEDGTKQLIEGLTTRLSTIYFMAIVQLEERGIFLSSIGAVTQLELELVFIQKSLKPYSVTEAEENFQSAREILEQAPGKKPVSSQQHLVDDMLEKSGMLVKSLWGTAVAK
eukprot:CAMPEP_0203758326 /NCGR_PEP_ID=MMETSP0098-20131031/11082_1 /ASSEMBLY_ACC=CAM_ASM_000208 /TAXON_ID=96639 /ORGANISM=" , Strain NY0313808BC1" /LENGTH=1303 /DNA_ID=CAMNT_0050650679 /DNA_START=159 /DNA_END=4070 /DNA_ORIENTATION=-